jgi:hypothetical protein
MADQGYQESGPLVGRSVAPSAGKVIRHHKGWPMNSASSSEGPGFQYYGARLVAGGRMGQFRTHTPQQTARLLDHLVSNYLQSLRDYEPK